MKPLYEYTALFAPGAPDCEGNPSQRLGGFPAPWESEVVPPLDVPRHFLPAAPKGCDGSPGFSRLHARPMAGQKYHCPTLRIIALPGAARQFQNVLFAPSPWEDLRGTSGLALAPHLAVGMDWMDCVFSCQGSGKDSPAGKSSEKLLLLISHGNGDCFPAF